MADGVDVAALERLSTLLWLFGSANDAQDRSYLDEAGDLRRRAADGIRDLLAERPHLAERFPTLARELESGHIEGFGWSNLLDAVERELAAARGGA
ncbi:MAG: hypothetical protein M5U13_01970 [Thermoanaerobaculia bacterium]|nr:hypothetical protein [Thermoanaerobaculia bacterium]